MSTLVFPPIYNCWVVLILCVYQVVMWIAAWGKQSLGTIFSCFSNIRPANIVVWTGFYSLLEGNEQLAFETNTDHQWRMRYTVKLKAATGISGLLMYSSRKVHRGES